MPIEARHICILFRRFVSYGEDVTRPYVEALEARGIRHLLVGGRAFHDREEIETLRSALMAIEWPDDQLSVFATLRGGLFAIGDEELLEYSPGGPPVSSVPRAETAAAASASRSRRTGAAGIASSRAQPPARRRHDFDAAWPYARARRVRAAAGGEQALANVLHVAELARQYEMDGGHVVPRLCRHAAGGSVHAAGGRGADSRGGQRRRPADDRAQGQGARVSGRHPRRHHRAADAVRGRPAHRSRRQMCARCGLAAGRRRTSTISGRTSWRARRRKASGSPTSRRRVRAICSWCLPSATNRTPRGGLRRSTARSIRPKTRAECRRKRQAVRHSRAKTPCSIRPDGDPASIFTVCPGEHRHGPPVKTCSVVWWAPDELALGAQASFGLRRDDLIVKDVKPAVLRQRLERLRAVARVARCRGGGGDEAVSRSADSDGVGQSERGGSDRAC